ncbi:MAG: hypothetical protein IPG42_02880 [Betaproteobacteria bacterium]|nr:hypothetical protein [Betaproteobacteria bacterium]MBK7656326.1 hypothetical protein [Betaproteobacteria bacterium]MBP9064176.1 hypothetical protein [Aquabacterium sp.]
MTPLAARVAPHPTGVGNLLLHRLVRALRKRARYRYVRPQVLREGDAYRIQSPNCSRNVDPDGGVIDIALLIPHGVNSWCLCSRDHTTGQWIPRLRHSALDDALLALCTDKARQFWP